MKKLLVCTLLLSFSSCFGQVDSLKSKDIKKLLEITGTANNVKLAMGNMIGIMKKNPVYKDIPTEFWDKFVQEINFDEFIEMYVPIYDKYYSHEDVKGIVKFYETPTGKKVIQNMPLIMSESMSMGQKWGMEIGKKIAEKMQKEFEGNDEKEDKN